jgi:hypothetical protein
LLSSKIDKKRDRRKEKMKKVVILAMAFLTVLMISMVPMRAQAAQGARSDLDIVWYANSGAAFTGLTSGQIDILQWPLEQAQKVAVEADPNLQIGKYDEMGMMEFDLNSNDTIADFPLTKSPTANVDVRRALACLTDKSFIITNILNNFAGRIDVPIAYPAYVGWAEPSVVSYDWNGNGIIEPSEDKYPYNFNVTKAVELLANAGFSDTDADGYLNYPTGWPGIGNLADTKTQTMKLKMVIRSDHGPRLQAGRLLVAALEGDPAVAGDSALATSLRWAQLGLVGGDFDTTDTQWQSPRAITGPIVMTARNYHVYTGGWSLGRFPTFTYFGFHSSFWYPGGSNYVTGMLGTHPAYDTLVRGIYYAVDLASSQSASRAACIYHVNNMVNIPLWSAASYAAWSKTLSGVVNMKGYGIVNDYTFLNAYKNTNPSAPLTVGAISGWTQLNILYSSWYFEYLLLDRVHNGLIAVNPYDLSQDIPWGAQDWETGTWVDPRDGLTKSTVTYYLRADMGAAAPVNGSFKGYFTADDYIWGVWYNYAYDDSWQWSSFGDINHVEKVNDWTVRLYFEDQSMWFVYSPTYPLLGPSWIYSPLLTTAGSASFTGADLVTVGSQDEYQFTTDKIVEVTSATKNGIAIYEGVDFHIRAGYDTFEYNTFVADTAFAPADAIVVNYRYGPALGAAGTNLGGNLGYTWTDTMYSFGYLYPISISTTSASLSKNQYFQMEVPLLGEVDWRWEFTGPVTKPRQGNFKIGILDVVKCTGSYSSRGDGIYNPVYLPGADLDASDVCHVGILDLVTITGKYAQVFGRFPDSAHFFKGAGVKTLPGYSSDYTLVGSYGCTVTGPVAGQITVTATKPAGFAGGWYLTSTGAKEYFIVVFR